MRWHALPVLQSVFNPFEYVLASLGNQAVHNTIAKGQQQLQHLLYMCQLNRIFFDATPNTSQANFQFLFSAKAKATDNKNKWNQNPSETFASNCPIALQAS